MLKLGILGCGGFIVRRILPFLGEMKSVRVVCIQNRNQSKAEEIAKQFAIPRAVSTREELLMDPDVEMVHIASPNFLHEEDALACAQAGKPTLCEKPLSTSLDSVNRMLDAFEQKSIPFFVGHQMRFKPAVQKARQIVLAKELGALLHLRAYYYLPALPKGDWRLEYGKGGEVLQEVGVHLIDLIHFISGETIADVRALSIPSQCDQMVSLQGKLPSGALVSLECAYGRPHYNGFELIGTAARLMSSESLRQSKDSADSLVLIKQSGEVVNYSLQATNVYVEEYDHLVEGIHSLIPACISRQSQSVIDAAYGSLSQNG